MKSVVQVILSTLVFLSVSVAGPVNAGSLWKDPTVSTCETNLCSAETMMGTWVNSRGLGIGSQPFVTQIYAQQGECLRIDVLVTQGNADAGMVLISPAGVGRVWRDDDSAGSLRPSIKVDGVPHTGWYTLHVSRWVPAQGSETWFRVRQARYNGGNPNCDNETLEVGEDEIFVID